MGGSVGMKKYITPEMTYKSFSAESIHTASAETAESKLRMKLTGDGYGIKAENIKTVNWVF